jgi:RNA polymerase subunit RPABC4/transcription elongation factor Spt4
VEKTLLGFVKGDTILTEKNKIVKPPFLWSIPFVLLFILLIVASADILIPFMDLRLGNRAWMLIVSMLISAVVSSMITELRTTSKRRTLISMVLATFFSFLVYDQLANLIQNHVVQAVQGSVPNPFINIAVYASFLTLVPGAIVGAITGGVLVFLPKLPKIRTLEEPVNLIKTNGTIHEKVCTRCGQTAPLESSFCPFCGMELSKRETLGVKFCMYCGSYIQYLGRFCPECGKEIDVSSGL